MKKTVRNFNWDAAASRQRSRLAVAEAFAEKFATAQFANEEPILAAGAGGQHGQIEYANASLLVEGYFSEPLTAFAVGFRDPSDIQATLDFLAPPVPTSRRFEYAEGINAEEFFSDTDDIRGIGSDFKDVEYKFVKTLGKTQNKGLSITVDLDEVSATPGWQERYTAKLQRRILRNELRRAVALVSAAAVNNAKTWDTTAGKDPDQDVRTDLLAAATLSGVRPNRVLYGDTAFDKRVISLRAQNNAAGNSSATLIPDNAIYQFGMNVAGAQNLTGRLATQLGVDGVLVSRERYQSATATKSEILNNLVFEFFATAGMDTEDASNIKRFISNTDSGGPWRVYASQISSKQFRITVETYSLIKVTSTLGLRKLTIS